MPTNSALCIAVHGGFGFALDSNAALSVDADAELMLAAHLPEGTVRPADPAGRIRHRECTARRARVRGHAVILHDVWNGRIRADVPHLLHAMALAPWRRLGLYSAHAACVAIPEGAVLIAGPSGSGKTSLSLEMARGGGRLLSGNKTLLRLAGGGIEAVAGTQAITLPASLAPLYPDLMPNARSWGGASPPPYQAP